MTAREMSEQSQQDFDKNVQSSANALPIRCFGMRFTFFIASMIYGGKSKTIHQIQSTYRKYLRYVLGIGMAIRVRATSVNDFFAAACDRPWTFPDSSMISIPSLIQNISSFDLEIYQYLYVNSLCRIKTALNDPADATATNGTV